MAAVALSTVLTIVGRRVLHLVDGYTEVDALEQLHAAPPGHAGLAATYFAAGLAVL